MDALNALQLTRPKSAGSTLFPGEFDDAKAHAVELARRVVPPSAITAATARVLAMSDSGFRVSTTKSAALPGAISPQSAFPKNLRDSMWQSGAPRAVSVRRVPAAAAHGADWLPATGAQRCGPPRRSGSERLGGPAVGAVGEH